MRKTLLLTVGCLLGIWTFCYAQNNPIIPDYLSSGGVGNNLNTGTPQVWSLLKYGGSAPNLYTGTVSASIPLYTYQDEDFTLPVVLNYASNGYMPNIQASDVGLGWFLNTGGVITRTVRGVPDDYMSAGLWGYFFNNQDFTNESWNLWANYINGQDKEMYSIKSGSMSVETEPDIYTFSFPGHYGKFISTGGKIHVFDTDDPHGEYSVEIYDPLVTSKVITIVTGMDTVISFWRKTRRRSWRSLMPMEADLFGPKLVICRRKRVQLTRKMVRQSCPKTGISPRLPLLTGVSLPSITEMISKQFGMWKIAGSGVLL